MKKLFTHLYSEKGIVHTIPLLIIVSVVGIISYLLISSTAPAGGLFGLFNPKPPSRAANTFLETFNGLSPKNPDGSFAPEAPKSFYDLPLAAHWDISNNATGRETGGPDLIEPMKAHHGDMCQAPDEPPPVNPNQMINTHTISTLKQSLFICNDHLMTSTNAGYGAFSLIPNQLIDFSQGEAVIKWDMSTIKTSGRDWLEFWVTPIKNHLLLAAERWGNSKPRNGLQLKMDSVPGGSIFRVLTYTNFTQGFAGELISTNETPWESVLTPSDSRLETFELHLSTTHVKFGIPKYNLWWVDRDIPNLGWNQGVVQFGQSSYKPLLPCSPGAANSSDTSTWDGTCGPTTWHYGNFAISPAILYTIIRGDQKLLNPTTTNRVNFSQVAPANSNLRFTGTANEIDVSFDNGASWTRAQLMPQPGNNVEGDEHPDDYFVPIPQGKTSVLFRGQRWWGGDWSVQNISIYAFNIPNTNPTPTPIVSSTPTPTPSPTPACPLGPLGDIDCNGKIDIFDYNILVTNLGRHV